MKRVETLRVASSEQQTLQLIAAAAHELKTPLTLISGLSSMLADSNRYTAAQSRASVERINLSSERLLRLIDSMLLGGKLSGDQNQLRLESICVTSVVEEVAHELTPLAHAQSRHFELKNHQPTYLAVANKQALFQVLYNLLDNAVKYSKPKTAVRVETRKYKNSIRINIEDKGAQITKRDLLKMFRMFGTVRQPISAYAGSSGLGLYIARHLTVSMRGELGVHKAPGGSCFYVALPRSSQLQLL